MRQTSDDDNTMTNCPSLSHSAVVIVASSSPPRGGHFHTLAIKGQSDAFPPLCGAIRIVKRLELARRRGGVYIIMPRQLIVFNIIAPVHRGYNKNNKKAIVTAC